MSDKYTIHNEAGLHVVTFNVVAWIAGPEVLCYWIEKLNPLTRHGYGIIRLTVELFFFP